MKFKTLATVAFLILFSVRGFSSHIVGGEIFYEFQGNNVYKITLKLYRDCSPGTAAYDDSASIGVYNVSRTLVAKLAIPTPSATQLTQSPAYLCIRAPTNVCVEEAIYTINVTLAPLAGGYDIVYQRCCRNASIVNLSNPGGTGATYTAHIPDPSIVATNSSPHYKNFPPIFICASKPLVFDHSAIDLDGDSLAYSLCDAYDGAPSPSNAKPVPPPPPPFTFVSYATPYTGSNPMASSPAFAINSKTGQLTGTPTMIGRWVVAVCVSEYRKGKLLSVNKRDFQFNVLSCNALVIANFVSDYKPDCVPYSVNFRDSSVGTNLKFLWKFSDGITSTLADPSRQFTVKGAYTITEIVTNNIGCADTAKLSLPDTTCRVLIPNVFTPNGDGHNDLFVIKNIEKFPNSRLIIFDRWGKKVYENADYQNNWNGTGAVDGTYYYIVTLTNEGGTKEGFVTVISKK